MTDRFPICHEITAKWEGGWSDHKADPGGKTMYGITEAVYHAWLKVRGLPLKPVRNISQSEAKAIYREQYWVKCGAPGLFPGVDLAVYDASVNSGVSRGLKWLKASVGSNDHSVTVKKICRARLSFVQSLKIWKTFGKGWGRRIADIEAKGVAMALAAMGASEKAIASVANDEAAVAKQSASTNDKVAKGAGGGAAAGGGATVADPSQIDAAALWVLGAVAAALVVVAIIAIARKKAAVARQEAYEGIAA